MASNAGVCVEVPSISASGETARVTIPVASDRVMQPGLDVILKKRGTSKPQITRAGLIDFSFNKLIFLFLIGSIVGLLIEVLYHAALFGEYQSRAGLIWGPFSSLYGAGAVMISVLLNYLWRCPGILVFLVSAVVGSTVEFVTSLGMEYFF